MLRLAKLPGSGWSGNMPMFRGRWGPNSEYGIESADPEIGSKIHVINGKYAIQSGPAVEGAHLGINGGMSPTTTLPGCNKEFWTCKQAWLHDTVTDNVIDSSIQLLNMTPSGTVIGSIDLDPVIYSIIKNIQVRTDQYERVSVAPWWVNPYYYDRYSRYEPFSTVASPAYMDLPVSYDTHTVRHLGGDVNVAANYIRPASYAGPLGPVFAGLTAIGDIVSGWPKSPWNLTNGPVDPCNIQVRDIKLDANDNLWVILQIGWEYCKPTQSQQSSQFFDQEVSTWVGYDDSSGIPSTRKLYDDSFFSRQYNPSGDKYRAGPIRPRVVIICFDKTKKYKTWDYVPFRPGTCGFNGTPRDARSRGPAYYGITVPPSRLDVDKYGNVYYSVGTADIWEQTTSYSQLHCMGIAKNEMGYLYVRPESEFARIIDEGLAVGLIGPYPYQCALLITDTNTVGYYNKNIGDQTRPAFRTPWTWTIGGDGITVTQLTTKAETAKTFQLTLATSTPVAINEEIWYATGTGNATMIRGAFFLTASYDFPHPKVKYPPLTWGPSSIRAVDNEWLTTNPSTKNANKDWDLLFAACDYLTRNYSYLASPTTYDCSLWWTHEVPWTKQLNQYTQLHPQKSPFFQIGNSGVELQSGWNPAEAPGGWYTHFTNKSGTYMDMECRAYTFKDTRGYPFQGFLPLLGGISSTQDAIFRVASSPYSQTGVVAGTDYFENCNVCGMLPTTISRVQQEDTLIIPGFDFKHETFRFTGITWDSYAALKVTSPLNVSTVAYPWRMHSMKSIMSTASSDGLDPSNYGPASYSLDPSSELPADQYLVPQKDRVFFFDESFDLFWADVASKMGRPEVQTVVTGIRKRIADSKFHYYNTGLPNLNFGAYASAINCEDSVGLFVPRYKMSIEFQDDYPNPGDYWAYMTTDTRPLRRLYIAKVSKKGELSWKPDGTKGTKTWWAPTATWETPASPALFEPPVVSFTYYDFESGQIAKLKEWEPDYTVEKYQQICFKNWYPKGVRRSPQFY